MKKNIRRILLILPPEFKPKDRPASLHLNPPLGISYIGAVLEKAGYEVKLLDAVIEGYKIAAPVNDKMVRIGIPFEEIRDRVRDFKPDLVGISSMFTMYRKNAHRVAAMVKEVDPSIPVVVGGAHPTAAPEMVMEDPNVDFLILAEGENSIIPLIKAIEQGGPYAGLDGVAYRQDGRLVVTKKEDFVQDLDTLPFPARHLLPMEKYLEVGVYHGSFGLKSMKVRPASLLTSRGCPYRCNFCTAFEVFTRRPRVRSVGNILKEIDELVHTYGVNSLFFEDDQFIAKTQRTAEFLEALAARKYDLTWDTPNGVSVWLLNDKILKMMKASGCIRVNLAVESGNQWVLDNIIHKPVKVDRVPAIVDKIRAHGMEASTFLVVGNISDKAVETLEQVRDSFRLARRVRVNPHVSYLSPYPGSEVLEVAQRRGYLIKDFDWDNLTISEQNVTTPEWTPEELRRVVETEWLLTNIWVKLSNPKAWLERFIPLLKGWIREDPWSIAPYYLKRIAHIAAALVRGLLFPPRKPPPPPANPEAEKSRRAA